MFRTDDFSQVATIPVGQLPHGIWPSGDGSRIYVGLENADALAAIDTATNRVVANVPIGQAPQAIAYVPQAIAYVPQAIPAGESGTQGLGPLGVAGQAAHLALAPATAGHPLPGAPAPTSVTLFDQGLLQVLQASVTGLMPKTPYTLALAAKADGSGPLEPLAAFMTNPAGSAVVNALGPIRQLVQDSAARDRRYLVIAPQIGGKPGTPVQIQSL